VIVTDEGTLSAHDTHLNVAFVTQWFPPEPVVTPAWIAEALRRQGLCLSVLTGIPNFPTGKVHHGYTPWRTTRETRNGFPTQRTPLYPSHDRSTIGRIANYSSFALSSSVLGIRQIRSADVALVYSSPATAATAAMVANVGSGTPYVLLILDLWPDSIFASGFLATGKRHRATERAITRFNRYAYGRAAHVLVTSPGMRELLMDRGLPSDKVSVVFNWVDEKVMRRLERDPEIRRNLGFTDEFVLMYAGNHGAAQALDVAIRAMAELRDVPDVHLLLVGDGIDKSALRSMAEGLKLKSVHFHDPVTSGSMPAMMAAADMQLVSLADRPLFQITLPSKVQSIFACGQPILACAPGDTARIVQTAGAGLTSPPGDHRALAQTIRLAHSLTRMELDQMGKAAKEFYGDTLSEAINARALAGHLRAAAKTRRSAHGG
jgi:glycosyltransferase involved in cell wall biosynthesis